MRSNAGGPEFDAPEPGPDLRREVKGGLGTAARSTRGGRGSVRAGAGTRLARRLALPEWLGADVAPGGRGSVRYGISARLARRLALPECHSAVRANRWSGDFIVDGWSTNLGF